jgi:phage-related protein
MRPEGHAETQEALEETQDTFEETAEEAGDTTDQLDAFATKWRGAMTAILAGLTAAVVGLLSQVPVVSDLMDGLAAIIDSLALKLDEELRPILGPLTDAMFDLAAAIDEDKRSLSEMVRESAGVIGAINGIIVVVNRLLDRLGVEIDIPFFDPIAQIPQLIGFVLSKLWDFVSRLPRFWGRFIEEFQRGYAETNSLTRAFLDAFLISWNETYADLNEMGLAWGEATNSILANIFGGLLERVDGFLDALKSKFSGAWGAVKNAVSSALRFIKTAVFEGFETIRTRIGSWMESIEDRVRVFVQRIRRQIRTLERLMDIRISQDDGGGGSVTEDLGGGRTRISGAASTRARLVNQGATVGLAEGGIVSQPTNALIGESGPEAVVPVDKLKSLMGAGRSERPRNIFAERQEIRLIVEPQELADLFSVELEGGTAIRGRGESGIR